MAETEESRRYLLDTNILSHLVRHPHGAVARRIREVGQDSVSTSIIVACELRYGCQKKQSAILSERIDSLLSTIEVLPLGQDVDVHYGAIRDHLERAGTPIGANDLLVAAHARALGLRCVTDNIREFSRVPDLQLENWLDQEDVR